MPDINTIESLPETLVIPETPFVQETPVVPKTIDVCEKLHPYICTSCGAELVRTADNEIEHCPFCEGDQFLLGSSNTAEPDSILPFAISQDEAIERCRTFCASRLMLPASFLRQLDEAPVKSVYVPLWLYSGSAKINVNFRVSEPGHARIIAQSGQLEYDQLPILASSKLPERFRETVLPFDCQNRQLFSLESLGETLAESFEEDASDAADNEDGIGDILRSIGQEERQAGSANVLEFERDILSQQATRILRNRLPYIVDSEISQQAIPANTVHERVLAPLWYLHTTWKKKEYVFCVNGQTGEVSADFPFNHFQMLRLRVFSFLASLPVIFILLTLVSLSITVNPDLLPRCLAVSGVLSVGVALFFAYRFMLSLLAEEEPTGKQYYDDFFATADVTDVTTTTRDS